MSKNQIMKRNRRKVTIRDVARSAGVSVSTVSRVLNSKVDVAEETMDRVRAVIDELGYASSLAARGMRSHRTNLIGLVVSDVASTYVQAILRGANRFISKIDYDLIIYTNGRSWRVGNAELEVRYVTLLNGSIADGTIVVTPTAHNFQRGVPLVIIDPNDENPDILSIIATNREGALEAMKYLLDLGHRRIGHITGRLDLVSGKQRLSGYMDGLESAGIAYDASLVSEGDYTLETTLVCAKQLLEMAEPPSAIFAGNDMSAMAVYQVAQEMGIRIPDQLSVIGFDNLPESIYCIPSLTTVDQNVETMGFIATELLMQVVRGETPESNRYILPTRLVIRESCRCVK